MRALLVANPAATSTSTATRDVIVRDLSRELDIEVLWTRYRGHASEIAATAKPEGFDLLVAVGGDGTVNEIVNGMLGDGPTARPAPALAVVPGGSTNVFARALGIPRDPVAATSQLVDALARGRQRRIGLGRADGRWFTFAAGVGLDAEVVRRVEDRRAGGSPSTPGLYLREAATTLALGGVVPVMQVHIDKAEPFAARMVVFANTRPWTYLGSRPVDPFPDASFEAGLDVFAVQRLDPLTVTRAVAGLLRGFATPTGRGLVHVHDSSGARVSAEHPFPLELDGEALPPRREVLLESVHAALTVIT